MCGYRCRPHIFCNTNTDTAEPTMVQPGLVLCSQSRMKRAEGGLRWLHELVVLEDRPNNKGQTDVVLGGIRDGPPIPYMD